MKPLPTLRTFLQEEGVQGIFIKGDSSIRYFTGFTGGESLLYVDALRAVLITDSRYILQAQQQAPECEILEHQHGLFSVVDQVRPAWRLALDGDYFSYTEATALQKALPKASFKNVNLVFLRAVKSPEDQRKMFKAAAIADDAFHELIPHIKVGRRESELAAELEYNMRKRGAQKTSFDTIVASGVRSALPHGVASNKVIEEGDFVTFDFGCIYDGYCSDMTRTVVMGKAAPWQKEIYEIVLAANELGEEVLFPGKTGIEVDQAVRDFIASKGYGAYFGHGLGHGVGLDIHEKPNLNKGNPDPIPVGAIVTVEPGIYLPGKGGVRIEDTVIVTEWGCERLTLVEKELMEIL